MNIYAIKELLLSENPISILYVERYIKLIQYAIENPTKEKYTEKHHILPKSMFPEYKSFSKNKWNIIKLSARQHFIAHWMLWKAFRNESMTYAFYAMNTAKRKEQDRYQKINSKIYKNLKEERAKFLKISQSGENNPFYGKFHSEETRKKTSIRSKKQWADENYRELYTGENHPMYGKNHKKSSIDKMIMTRTGKKIHSEGHKKRMSEKMKGEGNPMFNVRVSEETKDRNSKYGYIVYKNNGKVDIIFRIRGEYCEKFSYHRGSVTSMIGNMNKAKSYKDIIRVERYDKDYFVYNILPFIKPEFIDFSPDSVGKI